MGDIITKYHEMMSDREIMDAKHPDKAAIKAFEKEYPELSKEFKEIQQN